MSIDRAKEYVRANLKACATETYDSARNRDFKPKALQPVMDLLYYLHQDDEAFALRLANAIVTDACNEFARENAA
jgi:hypothetical protein